MNVEKRVVKTPKLYFVDTGLASYLTRWTDSEVLRSGAMSGAFFETYIVGEVLKSFCNAGIEPPLYFYRDKDKIEIDLIIFLNNTVYPVEIKKTATPKADDAKNFFYYRQNQECGNRASVHCLQLRKAGFCCKRRDGDSGGICVVSPIIIYEQIIYC